MKKLALMFAAAVAVSFASCQGGQKAEQEAAEEAETVEVAVEETGDGCACGEECTCEEEPCTCQEGEAAEGEAAEAEEAPQAE